MILLHLSKLKKKVSILSSKWCAVSTYLESYIFKIAFKNAYLFSRAISSILLLVTTFWIALMSANQISTWNHSFFQSFSIDTFFHFRNCWRVNHLFGHSVVTASQRHMFTYSKVSSQDTRDGSQNIWRSAGDGEAS